MKTMNFELDQNLDISDDSIEPSIQNTKMIVADKVIRILKQVKSHLDTTLANRELIRNLVWAINKIEHNSLYTDSLDEAINADDDDNPEKSEFLEGFQDFSFVNSIYKQNRDRDRIRCKTAHHADFMSFKNVREKLRSQKPDSNGPLKNVEEEDDCSSPEIKTKKLAKDFKKSRTILSSNQLINGGKIEQSPVFDLPIPATEHRFVTIDDEEIINFNIGQPIENITANKRRDELCQNYDMNSIINRNFNIYQFEAIFGREKSFVLIGKEMLRTLDLMNIIETTKLENFLIDLRNNYIPSNFYHNERHGADVGHTTTTYLKESEIIDVCFFEDLDIFSIVIAAISHDVGHPGMNNAFQINSNSEYTLTYHDKSVLENYHIYLLFKILRKPDSNIVSTFKKEDFTIFRKRVIETIIATDMSFHAKVVSSLKNKIFNWKELKKANEEELLISPNSKNLFDDQQEIINLLVHGADISHNTKPFKISEKWTEYLTEEFHSQGDKEKALGLPISFLCDRQTTNVPKSQIGFINFVIIPTFEVLAEAFPSLNYLVVISKNNVAEWEIKLKNNEKQQLESKN